MSGWSDIRRPRLLLTMIMIASIYLLHYDPCIGIDTLKLFCHARGLLDIPGIQVLRIKAGMTTLHTCIYRGSLIFACTRAVVRA